MSQQQLTLPVGVPPEPTLSNYVPGPNGSAVAALKTLVTGGQTNRTIYLWGPKGVGKTHLLQACAKELISAQWFDDLQDANADRARDCFVAFTQALSEADRILLCAADRPPQALGLREDLRTRLGQCLIFELKPLADEDLKLALSLGIAERGLAVSPDLIDYLVNRLPRNMGSQRAALDALDRLSLERKKPLTLTLARELFGPAGQSDTNSPGVSTG